MLMLEFIRSYVTATFEVSIIIITIVSFQIINCPSDLWKYTLFV